MADLIYGSTMVEMEAHTWYTLQWWFSFWQDLSIVLIAVLLFGAYHFREELEIELKRFLATHTIIERKINRQNAEVVFNWVFPYGNWRYYAIYLSSILTFVICQYSIACWFGQWDYATTTNNLSLWGGLAFPHSSIDLISGLFGYYGMLTELFMSIVAVSIVFDFIRCAMDSWKRFTEWCK
jgi:hypothetical protein